jgi:hypothetical protein
MEAWEVEEPSLLNVIESISKIVTELVGLIPRIAVIRNVYR